MVLFHTHLGYESLDLEHLLFRVRDTEVNDENAASVLAQSLHSAEEIILWRCEYIFEMINRFTLDHPSP